VFGDAGEGAAKVERLLADAALWQRAGKDSLDYFRRNHSPEEVLGRYARLFAELVP
jgi:glycosyltransferase involved in cell wall biosynthesis